MVSIRGRCPACRVATPVVSCGSAGRWADREAGRPMGCAGGGTISCSDQARREFGRALCWFIGRTRCRGPGRLDTSHRARTWRLPPGLVPRKESGPQPSWPPHACQEPAKPGGRGPTPMRSRANPRSRAAPGSSAGRCGRVTARYERTMPSSRYDLGVDRPDRAARTQWKVGACCAARRTRTGSCYSIGLSTTQVAARRWDTPGVVSPPSLRTSRPAGRLGDELGATGEADVVAVEGTSHLGAQAHTRPHGLLLRLGGRGSLAGAAPLASLGRRSALASLAGAGRPCPQGQHRRLGEARRGGSNMSARGSELGGLLLLGRRAGHDREVAAPVHAGDAGTAGRSR